MPMTCLDTSLVWQCADSYRLESLTWLSRYAEEVLLRQDLAEAERKKRSGRAKAYLLQVPAVAKYSNYNMNVVLVAEGKMRPQRSRGNLAEFMLSLYDQHAAKPNRIEETALSFARHYGFIGQNATEEFSHSPVDWEDMNGWQNTIDQLTYHRRLLDEGKIPASGSALITSAWIKLAWLPGRSNPEIVLKPWTFGGVIETEFALLAAGGARFVNCQECGTLFVVGGDSGKREDARFHSDICRTRFNNKLKAKAKAENERQPKSKRGP
jgi:hypothetical protein